MRRPTTPLLWSALLCAVGIVVAIGVARQLEVQQQADEVERFAELVQRAVDQLTKRFRTYEYGLRGLRGVVIVLGPDGLDRAKLIAYANSRDPEREFPGARGFGFIRRTPRAEEAAFLARARLDQPDFAIKEIAPHSGDRLVIQYISPETGNRPAIGLDIASEDNRRNAALQAMRAGQATLTHPITLAQASGQINRGFLLMLPVYRAAAELGSPEAREQAAYGLTFAPLVIGEILARFDLHGGEFALTLYDLDDTGHLDRFYDSSADQTRATDSADLVERRPLALFGRNWLVEIRALPLFTARLNHVAPYQVGLVIASGGLLLAGLLYGYLAVQARKQRSLQEQARLAAIVAGANDAIIGLTLDGRITNWNAAAETIFGYPESAAVGRRAAELIVPPELEAEEGEFLQQVVAGETVTHFGTRRRRADGSELHASVTVSPIRDAHGRVVGIAKTVRDISAEKAAEQCILTLNAELEQKVTERTAHLESAVRELVDFSYLASHDLRTPLRAIDGFSSLLARGDGLAPAEVSNYLQRIRTAAQHMGRIIDDMVALSHISHSESTLQDVDLTTLAKSVVGKLRAAESKRQVTVHIEPGLSAWADAKLVRILLTQLFDNAWKFTRDIAAPVIEFGSVDGVAGRQWFVRDNGPGFDMAYAERIFRPFQRLHKAEEFSGTGIGLAMVQRVVRKHGGTVRVESQPGEGATFYFTLST